MPYLKIYKNAPYNYSIQVSTKTEASEDISEIRFVRVVFLACVLGPDEVSRLVSG